MSKLQKKLVHLFSDYYYDYDYDYDYDYSSFLSRLFKRFSLLPQVKIWAFYFDLQCLLFLFWWQLFNRGAEQLEQWMDTREAIIQSEEIGAAEGAEALIKKHEDFTKTVAVQEAKIAALQENANQLIEKEHYDSPAIAERIAAVLARSGIWS